mgnify:CR=1 FL=1
MNKLLLLFFSFIIISCSNIESTNKLNKEDFKNYNTVGLTAGASTPDWIIEEVIGFIESI